MSNKQTTEQMRHAMGAGLALFAAVLVQHAMAFAAENWLILATLMTIQLGDPLPIRHGLIKMISMSCAMLISSMLMMFAPVIYVYSMAFILMLLNCYFFLRQSRLTLSIYISLLFLLVFVFAAISSSPSVSVVRERGAAIFIGSGIGILFNRFFFPTAPFTAFSRALKPVWQTLIDHTQQIAALFVSEAKAEVNLGQIKKNLLQLPLALPEWVYAEGFNPALREGYRYFLIHMEHLIDDLLVLISSIQDTPPHTLDPGLSKRLGAAMQKNSELMSAVMGFFTANHLSLADFDWVSDIQEIEKEKLRLVKEEADWLSLFPEYLPLLSQIDIVKEMRQFLLDLISILPKRS